MMFWFMFICSILQHLVSGKTVNPSFHQPYIQHEARDGNTPWHRLSRVPQNVDLPLKISLVQHNLDVGHSMLMDISDPTSKNYAKYYTMEELDELFAPPESDREMVMHWLESENVNRSRTLWTLNKQWIHLKANVSKIETMFKTKYYYYKHDITGDLSVGCERYSVPKHIHPLLDYIKPGIHLAGSMQKARSRFQHSKRDSLHEDHERLRNRNSQKTVNLHPHNCTELVTPPCYRKIYNITDELKPQPGNAMGIYESELDFLNRDSLEEFFRAYMPHISPRTFPDVIRIDGAPRVLDHQSIKEDRRIGGESDLDFQVSYPLVYPDRLILYQVDDIHWERVVEDNVGRQKPNGEFNNWLDAFDGSYCNRTAFGITGNSPKIDPIYPDPSNASGSYKGKLQCGRFKAPGTLSISYGIDEEDYPTNYLRRQCSEWMKLGLNGTTIVAATGDTGVHPFETKKCEGPNKKAFGPGDPTTCPYILAAGATALVKGKSHEVASTLFKIRSTGGFSNVYPRPAYQEKAVRTYFEKHEPPYPYYKTKYQSRINETGRYNRIGRGYPDISAIGQDIAMFTGGRFFRGLGTSASAPLWAALITRINNARLAAGKQTVGFINPVLYQHPEVLNDIVKGNNRGCGTSGFKAVKGWDPVTGLGSPNYGKMKDLFLSLP